MKQIWYALLAGSLWLLSNPPGFAQPAPALEQPLFAPAAGLRLVPNGAQINVQRKKLYGETSAAANWDVGQWDIPRELPAFRNNLTRNTYASVQFIPGGGFSLSQNGSSLPCTKVFPSGKQLVDEFDLLVSPTTGNYPDYPQAFLPPRRALQSLSYAELKFSVLPATPELYDAACHITWASVGIGIVLTNLAARQTLFYQLNFVLYQGNSHGVSLAMPAPNWFSTGVNMQTAAPHQFGFGDRAWASFAMPPLSQNVRTKVDLNVLPRIEQIILEGQQFGMDTDLGDWAISGEYFGQSVFGHIEFATQWSGISLNVR